MKECTKCHRTLPESDFYKKSGSPDGLQYVCKDCQSAYYTEHPNQKTGGGDEPRLLQPRPCPVHPAPAHGRAARKGIHGRIEIRANN